jgi:uncharacterized iron-regulated protein
VNVEGPPPGLFAAAASHPSATDFEVETKQLPPRPTSSRVSLWSTALVRIEFPPIQCLSVKISGSPKTEVEALPPRDPLQPPNLSTFNFHASPAPSVPGMNLRSAVLALGLALLAGCATVPPPAPPAAKTPPPARDTWINLVSAEEATNDEVLSDLAGAGVVFVGEAHTNRRHHAVQFELLQALFARGVPLVLCLEQIEARYQPAVDRYVAREIDFATLARDIDWPNQWRNFADYRALCEFARQHRIPIRALNAPAATIRAVSRGGGLAKLPPEQRADLPAEIWTDDPVYERITNQALAAHMALDPARLRPVFEAQAARDETMAAHIVAARRAGAPADKPRTAFVVTGGGHMRFGLGTAERVRRRDPGIVERLVLVTEGDPREPTAEEKAQTRPVSITHADLRPVGRPPADYLRFLSPSFTAPALPPGHPPIPATK